MSLERQSDNANNPWWGEHVHRYEEVVKLLTHTNICILDIACGSGFGSFLLSQKGYKVIGGDLSFDTIESCKQKYKSPNLIFKVVDGTRMPYPNETFDALISFETIEHTNKFYQMLDEFKRVCKKDGMIIISTPNFLINSPDGIIINKFHTQEWIYEEFYNILSGHFSSFKIYGQQYIRYKNKKGLKYTLAEKIENILYLRGFRKLPIFIQDKIMKTIIGLPMYPQSTDFDFIESVNQIKKCKTFFAICKP